MPFAFRALPPLPHPPPSGDCAILPPFPWFFPGGNYKAPGGPGQEIPLAFVFPGTARDWFRCGVGVDTGRSCLRYPLGRVTAARKPGRREWGDRGRAVPGIADSWRTEEDILAGSLGAFRSALGPLTLQNQAAEKG